PAQQRLQPADIAGYGNQGLIVDAKMGARSDRAPQFRFKHGAQLDGFIHGRCEEAVAVPPLVLGSIKGDVSLAHEVRTIRTALGCQGGPETDPDMGLVAKDLVRPLKTHQDTIERAFDPVADV